MKLIKFQQFYIKLKICFIFKLNAIFENKKKTVIQQKLYEDILV